MKKCDIVIPVWNEREVTEKCVNALKRYTRYPYRLIIVDNGSEYKTSEYLKSLRKDFPDYLLIRNRTNLGFVKAANQGMKRSNSPYVCLLNNDAYVTDHWLADLVMGIEEGPRQIGLANPSSNVFGIDSPDGEIYELEELDSCKGFCMIIKHEVIKRIGYFDEIYGMGYFEEKDFAKRAKSAGYISVRVKSSFVYHEDRLSFDKIAERDSIFKKNESIYNKKWGSSFNIAFFIKSAVDLENKRKFTIYKLLDEGNTVHIFFSSGKPELSLKEHIGIKHHRIMRPLFRYVALFKLWERRKKKRIDIIVAHGKTLEFFEKFQNMHGAGVFQDSEEIIDICKRRSKNE